MLNTHKHSLSYSGSLWNLQQVFYDKYPVKGIVHPKIKIDYLLHSMPMEGWVKCLNPQNTFRVSGVNGVRAKSNTIEVNETRLFPSCF